MLWEGQGRRQKSSRRASRLSYSILDAASEVTLFSLRLDHMAVSEHQHERLKMEYCPLSDSEREVATHRPFRAHNTN